MGKRRESPSPGRPRPSQDRSRRRRGEVSVSSISQSGSSQDGHQSSQKWHARSDGGMTKRCAEPVQDGYRWVGGGAETLRDPRDEVASPPSSVSVENHWGEGDDVLVASVAGVVERSPGGLAFCQLLCRGCHRSGFRVAWRRQEETAKSQAPGIMSFPWRDWHVVEVRRCLCEAGGRQPCPSEDAHLLPGQLRGRRGPPRCRGSSHLRMGRLHRSRRSGREIGSTGVHCVCWSKKEMWRRCCSAVQMRSVK